MKKRAYNSIKRGWLRVGVWVAAASLAVLYTVWPNSAYGACGGGLCDWQVKRKLTFDNSLQAENLVDVPVLVVLNSSRIDYSKTQDQGQDLRFTDSDGTTLLDHEIEKWDETGNSFVWVKVPQIDGSSSTDHIWMYYGHPTAPDGQNPTAVWSNGFATVWHLTNSFNDSTSNNHDATLPGTWSWESIGKIAGGVEFQALDVNGDEVSTGVGAGQDFTLEFWYRGNTAPPSSKGYDDHFVINAAPWDGLAVGNFADPPGPYIDWTSYGGCCRGPMGTNFGQTTDDLYTLTLDWNGAGAGTARLQLYKNGSFQSTYDLPQPSYPGSIRLGNPNWNTYQAGASIDEFRISTTVRSDAWVAAQYKSMTDAFITYGAEEGISCGPTPSFSQCDWEFRRKLTFDNSAQAENLMNFPVLVVLNSSRIDYGSTQGAGQDLRFIDADGTTLLAHEIEKWDETGTSYVWVKVPQIDASSNTDYIWMYYGNATAADGQDAGGVWTNGFEAVWHLHNDFRDSTCNAHDATNVGSTDTTDGVAADGQSFDGNNDYMDTNFNSDYGASQNFTWEGWFKVNNINGSDDILGIEDRFCTDPPGCTTYAGDKSEIRLSVRNPSGPGPVTMYDTWIRPDSGTSYAGTPSISPTSNEWHYAALLRDGSTGRLYLDGSEVDSNTVSTNALTFPRTPNTLLIGAQWQTDSSGQRNFMDGKLDEIRTSMTARSAAWIAATYKSIKDTFITYGAQEGSGAAPEVAYFIPDAFAGGMSVPVTFIGSFCSGMPTVTTSSSDIVVGPSIVTDSTGAVVTQNGTVLSTVFFVKPDARPTTGVTVSVNGTPASQTFDIVIPSPDPNGGGTLSRPTKRGTTVLGGLTVGSGQTLSLSTADTDGVTPGNQGYLPAAILVKGDVNIAGTLDVSGTDGTNAGASCAGGNGGVGGPGGGGGGGGGVTETGCGGGGGPVTTDLGPLHDTYVYKNDETPHGSEIIIKVKKSSYSAGSVRQGFIKFDTSSITDTITSATLKLNVIAVSGWPDSDTLEIKEYTDNSWDESTVWSTRPPASAIGAVLGTVATPVNPDPTLLTIDVTAYVLARRAGGNDVISFTAQMANNTNGGARISTREGTVPPVLTIVSNGGGGGGTAAPGAAGYSGGGGGGAKGAGSGAAGGDGTNAAGATASGTTGGDGGVSLAGSTGGGAGWANTQVTGGDGGGGGTGDPFGSGGSIGGPFADGGPGGQGGGGGGAAGGTPGGGGGGAYTTAGGTLNGVEGDAGLGGTVYGTPQLVPLAGGSAGGGGGPDKVLASTGGGGGGGGGAVLLYATGAVSITGTIKADGGNGGNGYDTGSDGSGGGGGGSGGAILVQSGDVTASGTFTASGGNGGAGYGDADGGAGGDGRIRIDGLAASATVPGTAGSKFIGPVIDSLVGTTVTGRADGASTVTLYAYDDTGAQVTGSPYATTASGSTGTVGTWSIAGVTFPAGTGYLAVKQSAAGGGEVFGPGRATRGVHLINWREVY